MPVRKAGCGEKNDAGTYGNQCGNRLGIRVGPQPALTSLFPDRARGPASPAEAAPPAPSWKRLVGVGCMPQVPECTRPPLEKVTSVSDDVNFCSPHHAHAPSHTPASLHASSSTPRFSSSPGPPLSPQHYLQFAHPSSDTASPRFLTLSCTSTSL